MDPERRRRARTLTGTILLLIPLGIAAIAVTRALTSPGAPFLRDPIVLSGSGAILLGPPLYFLSRSRHAGVAAWITILATNVATWSSLLTATDTQFQSSTPYFVGLGPFLATAFLPLGATLGLVLANMAGLLLLPHFHSGYSWFEAINPLIFLAILSGFVLVVSGIRHNDLKQIRSQRDRLKESEGRYRHLFHSSFEAIIIHDNGKIVAANEAAAQMFLTDVGSMVGHHVLEFTQTKDQPQVVEAVRARSDGVYTMRAARSDGSEIEVEVMGKEIRYGGKDARLVAIRDITERKRAEAAQRFAHEQELEIRKLREVSDYKSAIFNMAAHELNTPLTPIRMQLHMLRQRLGQGLDAKTARSFEILDRNMDRLSGLVHDFLDVARIEHGILRLDLGPVDVARVASDCIDSFQEQADRMGVTLRVEVDRHRRAPKSVVADEKRLTEVLYNLVANALRFTPSGGAVRVVVHKGPDAVQVSVVDTGVGMKPHEQELLFQPFASLRAGRHGEGTGLGLYICKGFVDAHGGRIWCESEGSGHGSTFAFELPNTPSGTEVDIGVTADGARPRGPMAPLVPLAADRA